MDKASRDQLTGLLNREGFGTEADKILAESSRYGIGFAVVFFDIDRFKDFNDTYGHQFGDRVLTSIARCFRETIREQDLAARVGGDEFTLLLRECKEPEARDTIRTDSQTGGGKPDRQKQRSGRATLSAGLPVRAAFKHADLFAGPARPGGQAHVRRQTGRRKSDTHRRGPDRRGRA